MFVVSIRNNKKNMIVKESIKQENLRYFTRSKYAVRNKLLNPNSIQVIICKIKNYGSNKIHSNLCKQ